MEGESIRALFSHVVSFYTSALLSLYLCLRHDMVHSQQMASHEKEYLMHAGIGIPTMQLAWIPKFATTLLNFIVPRQERMQLLASVL